MLLKNFSPSTLIRKFEQSSIIVDSVAPPHECFDCGLRMGFQHKCSLDERVALKGVSPIPSCTTLPKISSSSPVSVMNLSYGLREL